MTENKSSYRQIFKATSIFGGVQVINIGIAIIRSKFIAILLGPIGMGIAGLLTSTIALITGLTNFGLSTSAVKNVAAAYGTGDEEKLGKTVAIFRRLVWATGLLGLIVTIILAPWLSKITFGNNFYTTAFLFLSISLLLTQLHAGQDVVLRGTRKIQYLAKSSTYGAIVGLLTSVPLYYFFGVKGIVPAIIISSLTIFLITLHFSRKVIIPKYKPDKKLIYSEGAEMLKMGFLISLSGLITLGVSYLVRIYISNKGGVAEVGLYSAGFAIITTYVGLVFTAMSTDYFPRLSAVAHNNNFCKDVINQQAEIAILILAPIIVVFLIFINWVVILLYSKTFTGVNNMILWAAMGMFFKATSWSIAFIFLAKGTFKLFFWNELITNIYLLVFNILGYKYFGLTGLGISFMVSYIIYAFQVYFIARIKFQFLFSSGFYKIFIIQFVLAVLCFILVKLLPGIYAYIFGSCIIVVSVIFSFKELDARLGLKPLLIDLKIKYFGTK